MIAYNLYVKELNDGRWKCGVHGNINEISIEDSPTQAVVDRAFRIISKL